MFAVCVDLWIKPGKMDAFLPLLQANASQSVATEAGCVQFDIVRSDKDPDLVVLYELYESEADFEAHLLSDHFAAFDVATAQMLQTKSIVKGARINTAPLD